jgi:curved DNA-binding protein CbpA
VSAAPTVEAPAANGVRARILSRYALVESGDYFQVLGVPRDATPADVEAAHDRVAREVGEDVVGPDLAGELRPEIEAIRVVAGEALRILRDEQLRSRYRAHLPS